MSNSNFTTRLNTCIFECKKFNALGISNRVIAFPFFSDFQVAPNPLKQKFIDFLREKAPISSEYLINGEYIVEFKDENPNLISDNFLWIYPTFIDVKRIDKQGLININNLEYDFFKSVNL